VRAGSLFVSEEGSPANGTSTSLRGILFELINGDSDAHKDNSKQLKKLEILSVT